MSRRSRKEQDQQPAIETADTQAVDNDADSALVRIREKEAEIAARLMAVRDEAEDIVAAAERHAREIRADAVREAERLGAERAAEITREAEGAIAERELRSAAARAERERGSEARIDVAAEYLVDRITTV